MNSNFVKEPFRRVFTKDLESPFVAEGLTITENDLNGTLAKRR